MLVKWPGMRGHANERDILGNLLSRLYLCWVLALRMKEGNGPFHGWLIAPTLSVKNARRSHLSHTGILKGSCGIRGNAQSWTDLIPHMLETAKLYAASTLYWSGFKHPST